MFRRILGKLLRRGPAPLTGAPARRREKTYAAQSGYVYHYFYTGRRAVEAGVEYVFDVSGDRRALHPLSVLVEDAALAQWESRAGRALGASERYAIAKLGLFQAFDERAHAAVLREPVRLRAADVDAILESLGIS